MLSGVQIFSSDVTWRQILKDLNATVLDAPSAMALNLDNQKISLPVSVTELKAIIFNSSDNTHILEAVFGKPVYLSCIQSQIVVALFHAGGMCLSDLKSALGYAPNTSTHAVDTAIYQLRKMFGHDFIINNNGVYKLGRI